MPNSFKRKISRNLNGATTVGNYLVPANTEVTVIGLTIANTNPTSAITASVYLFPNSGIQYYLVKDATIPIGGTLVVVGGDQKLVMEPNDQLYVSPSIGNSCDVIMSILEIT